MEHQDQHPLNIVNNSSTGPIMETEKEKLFHEEFMENSIPIEGKNPPTYLLPFRPITAKGDRYRLGEYQESGRCMNILFLGFTGSGKSMLVETMGNYGLGVDFRDPYRFQVKMEESTDRSISHTFFARDARRFPRPVSLIDTPGFQKGTEQICTFVHSNYLDVHAVVYVVQGSQGYPLKWLLYQEAVAINKIPIQG
ncbi:unnamed protein product [Darwinula stevensoni]|uniref:G domain-containing protein n=1 Tax=Darwinula stevensoni TaxID=69355 RepID=A0A7R8XGP9_9CRUS|nr:unnamed protein product [Darwinula stevensoni]CAG0891906.1 unnamed protein product [Darwinula stevensoni]